MPAETANVHSRVERELIGCLAKVLLEPGMIDRKISKLEERLGVQVYSELLHLLCHLNFPPLQAKLHWQRVLKHRDMLTAKIGSPVDLRVAVLDYFIRINQHFRNPKIIEIQIFKKTQDCALRDELTGLYNYRHLRSQLDIEMRRARRQAISLSLAIFDVDYFKWYNDRNGHLEGDKALKTVARILKGTVRECDIVARYGGEEFVVLFPSTNKPKAFKIAQRIREKIATHPFAFAALQPSGRFSVSGGVATFRADATDGASLLEAADRALYMAKGTGKDRVLTAGLESREFRRFVAEVPGELQVFASETQPFVTENLSEHGLQFTCAKGVQEGDYFRFSLKLPGAGEVVEGVGRATHVAAKAHRVEAGAQIVEMDFVHAKRFESFVQTLHASNAEEVPSSAAATPDPAANVEATSEA